MFTILATIDTGVESLIIWSFTRRISEFDSGEFIYSGAIWIRKLVFERGLGFKKTTSAHLHIMARLSTLCQIRLIPTAETHWFSSIHYHYSGDCVHVYSAITTKPTAVSWNRRWLLPGIILLHDNRKII